MFINPVEESPMNSNNALLEELSEIENSINNSNTIKPIESEKKEEKEPEVKKEEQPKFIQQPTVEDDELDFIEEFEDEEQENQIPETKEEKTIVIPETKINNFKDVLQLIRDCSEKIEDAGFIIDTEEYDLDDMYQIIFKINK